MATKDEALKLALEYMNEYYPSYAKQAAHHHRVSTALREALAEQPVQQQEPVNKYCCHLCFNNTGQLFLDRMILCPECGNKRCPKATHHSLACTKSNDLGQKGSIYDQPAQQEPVAICEYCEKERPIIQVEGKPWVGLTDEQIDLFINGRGDEDDEDYVEPTGDGFGLTDEDLVRLVRRAEAKLREENT